MLTSYLGVEGKERGVEKSHVCLFTGTGELHLANLSKPLAKSPPSSYFYKQRKCRVNALHHSRKQQPGFQDVWGSDSIWELQKQSLFFFYVL